MGKVQGWFSQKRLKARRTSQKLGKKKFVKSENKVFPEDKEGADTDKSLSKRNQKSDVHFEEEREPGEKVVKSEIILQGGSYFVLSRTYRNDHTSTYKEKINLENNFVIEDPEIRDKTDAQDSKRKAKHEREEIKQEKTSCNKKEEEQGNMLPPPSSKSTGKPEKLPRCVICNEDAPVRCLGCSGDLFCSACYKEFHVGEDPSEHRAEKYK